MKTLGPLVWRDDEEVCSEHVLDGDVPHARQRHVGDMARRREVHPRLNTRAHHSVLEEGLHAAKLFLRVDEHDCVDSPTVSHTPPTTTLTSARATPAARAVLLL